MSGWATNGPRRCVAWGNGRCRLGDRCLRLHEVYPPEERRRNGRCNNFEREGTCPYGTVCRFQHERPGDSGWGAPSSPTNAGMGWDPSDDPPADSPADQGNDNNPYAGLDANPRDGGPRDGWVQDVSARDSDMRAALEASRQSALEEALRISQLTHEEEERARNQQQHLGPPPFRLRQNDVDDEKLPLVPPVPANPDRAHRAPAHDEHKDDDRDNAALTLERSLLTRRVEELEGELQRARATSAQLQESAKEAADARLGQANERARGLEERCRRLEVERDQAVQRANRSVQLQRDVEEARQRADRLEGARRDLQQANRALEDRQRVLEREAGEARDRFDDLNTRYRDLEGRLTTAENLAATNLTGWQDAWAQKGREVEENRRLRDLLANRDREITRLHGVIARQNRNHIYASPPPPNLTEPPPPNDPFGPGAAPPQAPVNHHHGQANHHRGQAPARHNAGPPPPPPQFRNPAPRPRPLPPLPSGGPRGEPDYPPPQGEGQ